jgi:hypothetical protein
MVGTLEYRQQISPIMDVVARFDWLQEQNQLIDDDEAFIIMSRRVGRGSDPRLIKAINLVHGRFEVWTEHVDRVFAPLDEEYDGHFLALRHRYFTSFGVEAIVRYLSRL